MVEELVGRVALGVAGFSLAPRDRSADLATIRAGIAAGTAILDTARAYARVDAPLYGEELAAVARIDAVQNHHSAMGRESLEVLAWCEANKVPFFACSPLRSSFAVSSPHLTAMADARGVSVQRLQLRALQDLANGHPGTN
jgi:aryl-alcohol dehydrogenase-like predicted oxidoreductase